MSSVGLLVAAVAVAYVGVLAVALRAACRAPFRARRPGRLTAAAAAVWRYRPRRARHRRRGRPVWRVRLAGATLVARLCAGARPAEVVVTRPPAEVAGALVLAGG